MYSEWVKAICQMGIFLVCAQMLVHLRPDGSFEKYLKMLVGIMLLVQLMQPVSNLFGRGESMEERVNWFEQFMRESLEAAAVSGARADALRQQMTLSQVREEYEREQQEVQNPNAKMTPIEPVEIAPVQVESVELEMHEAETADDTTMSD